MKGFLYEDNLLIDHSTKKTQSSRFNQNSIKKLENWADIIGLKFSATRNEEVHFWSNIKRNTNINHTTLKLCNEDISKTETTRFLGMTLDRKLCWKPHILFSNKL